MLRIKDSQGIKYDFTNYTHWANTLWDEASEQEQKDALQHQDGEDEPEADSLLSAKTKIVGTYIARNRNQIPAYFISSQPLPPSLQYHAKIIISWQGDHWEVTKCLPNASFCMDQLDELTSFPLDFITHKSSWRDALVVALQSSTKDADKSHWQHELACFDAAHKVLENNVEGNPLLVENAKDLITSNILRKKAQRKRLKKLEKQHEAKEREYLETKELYGKGSPETNDAYGVYEDWLNKNEQDLKSLRQLFNDA